ncbi:putative DNA binding protein [Halorubrum trapanicum]|uniref:Putative DNA binding protein n=1 Tax=Halorubrum trapanicum TaxID=29284 RepID=A0A8J7UMZ1_9EURY|nr:helix-turn-helix domain-containing protein [Halorubrum trapanicum]MBP1902599.1 putative DNA binding protein [Halorubrum trapanicum]
MPDGIRVGLAVHGAAGCPVAALSARRDEPVTDVAWTRSDGSITEEFRVRDPESVEGTELLPDAASVVDLGDERVYRYRTGGGTAEAGCACAAIESLGVPVAGARAEDGALLLTLHLPDLDRLRDAVAALDDVADRVAVRYLIEGTADEATTDRTVVDRGRLTTRQREVLATAHRMGYFERPRGANAEAVAAELDIAPATFAEHLATAQRKLLDEALPEG